MLASLVYTASASQITCPLDGLPCMRPLPCKRPRLLGQPALWIVCPVRGLYLVHGLCFSDNLTLRSLYLVHGLYAIATTSGVLYGVVLHGNVLHYAVY